MSDSDGQLKLASLLRELGAEAIFPASVAIEVRLRAECRERRRWRVRQASIGIGIAACVLMALGWQWQSIRQPKQSKAVSTTMLQTPNYAGFVALPYAQSDVPMEQAFIVRVNLQPADIAALGLPSSWRIGTRRRRADLLIGQDGIARAVRFTE